MPIKLKVALPGFNVLTETNPRNIVYDSTASHLKTVQSGKIVKTVNASSIVSETIDHKIGIIPMVMGFFRESAGQKWFIAMGQAPDVTLSRPLSDFNVSIGVTETKIIFYFINNAAGQKTIEVQYEIFSEGI